MSSVWVYTPSDIGNTSQIRWAQCEYTRLIQETLVKSDELSVSIHALYRKHWSNQMSSVWVYTPYTGNTSQIRWAQCEYTRLIQETLVKSDELSVSIHALYRKQWSNQMSSVWVYMPYTGKHWSNQMSSVEYYTGQIQETLVTSDELSVSIHALYRKHWSNQMSSVWVYTPYTGNTGQIRWAQCEYTRLIQETLVKSDELSVSITGHQIYGGPGS